MDEFVVDNPIDGLTLLGRFFPPPKKPKAVMALVHGFGEHSGRYSDMADYLAQSGIATIALDLRGHGLSNGKRGVSHDYSLLRGDVDALLKLAREKYPGLPLFLYGHSMGGGLVLHHALRGGTEDVSGVIASAPLITLPKAPPAIMKFLGKIARRLSPNAVMKNTIPGHMVSTLPAEQEKYEQDPLNHDQLGLGLADDIINGGQWVLDHAADWNKPLLLIHARNDKLTAFSGSEAFAAQAQNCTFIPFDDCEHEIHNDVTRDAAYKALTDFIEARL